MSQYIDLKCDFGFKYCLSDEIVMKSFLNAILEGETDRITSVQFENVEDPGETREQRGVTFDLLCTTDRGETVLIEMQNSTQKYFRTRSMFYVYNLMRKQITRGFKWDKMEHDISQIFGIFIMGEKNDYLTKSVTRTSVYDRDELLEFWDRNHNFYVSLPHFQFNKENITIKDIWLYLFKDLGSMDRIDPSVYERADEGLLRLLEKANIAALSEEDYNLYEASMKALEDEMDMEKHGYELGKEEGMKEGMQQGIQQGIQQGMQQVILSVAKELKEQGVPIEIIEKTTHLSPSEIEKL